MAEATQKKTNKRRGIILSRLSYAFLAEPKTNDHDELEYSTQLLYEKGGASHKKLQQLVLQAIVECPLANGNVEKAKKLFKAPNFKNPIRDADAEGREGAEYEGMMFSNAKTNAKKGRPGIVLKNGTKLTDPDDIMDKVYSGCKAQVSVTAYYFDNSGNKGIALALNNVMKWEDGERLDGNVKAEDEFADFIDPDAVDEDDDFGLDDDDDFDTKPRGKKSGQGAKGNQRQQKPGNKRQKDDDFDLDDDDDDLGLD